MRLLRGYAIVLGALFTILAYLLRISAPTVRTYSLWLGGFGLLLLIGGLIADRARVSALIRGRRARAAGASALYVVTVLAVVVLVNLMAGRHHKRIDLTENKAFSLSEQTIKVLSSLPRDVALTVFYRETEPARDSLEDLLDEYRYHSDRLSVRFIDPDKNPGDVSRFGITQDGTLVFESGGEETRITSADEESITNALIKVVQDRERIVYFVSGHGERALNDEDRGGLSNLKADLEKQHYGVQELILGQGVPEDASVLVIAGPDKKYLDDEIEMVSDYLDRAGRLFLLQDPGTDPGLGEILARYGASIRKDVIIDKYTQVFGGDARIPLVPADGYDASHPITKNFAYQTSYPVASSIALDDPAPEGVTDTALAQTSELSWGETSVEEVESGRIRMDEGVDIRGPMTVGAAVVRAGAAEPADETHDEGEEDRQEQAPSTASETRILLFGDSDFASNAYLHVWGNSDLVLNGIAWLAEKEELVSIRPKTSTPSVLILSRSQAVFYLWTMVVLAPLAAVATGVGVWIRRKKL